MEAYLLPWLMLFPMIYSLSAVLRPSLLQTPLIYLGAVIFFTLTGLSALRDGAIEFVFFTIPLSAQTPLITMGLSIDSLSGVIGSTVLVIGAVVARFSYRYLEDDPQRLTFMKNLSWTMSSVLLMLMAQNMVIFFLAWVATSYFLHQLLTHFHQRPEAIKAARQKFWISRLGDVFLVASSILIYSIFKTLDFAPIFQSARDLQLMADHELPLQMAALFLVFGAMSKSAQFPFHFWLPNTMETPTPVSAIMHAGIINAGGYLIIRMSPLLSAVPMSLSLLTFIGGFTTFYAATIMLTQTNIKKSLAYSTIAQMGFMMLQCGLGAFSLAALHIVGHAFYKAYVFLSSGTATDYGRLQRYFPSTNHSSNLWTPYLAGLLSLMGVFGVAVSMGYQISDRPGDSILLFVLSLAIAQIAIASKNQLFAISVAVSFGISYKILGSGMALLLGTSIAAAPEFNILETALQLMVLPFFTALYMIQNNLELINQSSWGQRLYVTFYNGGFFGKYH